MLWRGTFFLLLVSMVVFGADVASHRALAEWGAKTAAIWAGEPYRLFTATFLHADLRHLLLNTYALYFFGRVVEALLGPARFVVVYLVSGATGYVASLLARPGTTSLGASAAIFGLIGYTLHYRLRRLPRRYMRIDTELLQILGLNPIIGFLVPRIDQVAHLGGLLGGAVAGLLVGLPRAGVKTKSSPGELAAGVAVLGIVAALVLQPAWVASGLGSVIPSSQEWVDRRYGPFLAPLRAESIALMWAYTGEGSGWQPASGVVRVAPGRQVELALFWRWTRGSQALAPVAYTVRWELLSAGEQLLESHLDRGVALRPDEGLKFIYARGATVATPGRWLVRLEVEGREVWHGRVDIATTH